MITLLCSISNNDNAIAILEGQPTERFLVSKSGEFRHDATLQFPDYLLKDKVSGEESAEMLLRGYFQDKLAAKLAAEKVEAEKEEKAAKEIKRRCYSFQNAVAVLNEHGNRRDYVEPTIKALRAALKKAEAKVAREKEAEQWKKICTKACEALLKKAPKAPLKGAGYAREDFPCLNHSKMQAIFAAIPASHKDEIASRRQKGYFSWSRIVSPEAMQKVSKLITLISK